MKKFVNGVQSSDLEHLDVRHGGRRPYVIKTIIPRDAYKCWYMSYMYTDISD
jgi:hypothetical protein